MRTSQSSTCCEVPDPTSSRAALPLWPPVQSVTASPAGPPRALGTSGASTRLATETPSAVASRQIVATLGFVRACSTCRSIPLLTPARAARSSSVQANLVRCPRTLRPTAALTSSGSGTVRSHTRTNKLDRRVQYSVVQWIVPRVHCTGIWLVEPDKNRERPWNCSGSCSPCSPSTWPPSCSPPTPARASSTPPGPVFTARRASTSPVGPAATPPAAGRRRDPSCPLEPRGPARAELRSLLGGRGLLRRHPVPPPVRPHRRLLEPAGRRPRPRRRPGDLGHPPIRPRGRLGPRRRRRKRLRPGPLLPQPRRRHHVRRRPHLRLRRHRSRRRRPPHRQPTRHPRRPRRPHRHHRRHPRVPPPPVPPNDPSHAGGPGDPGHPSHRGRPGHRGAFGHPWRPRDPGEGGAGGGDGARVGARVRAVLCVRG